LPGEPATPTPPITSLPNLIGKPPSSDVMFGSSTWARRAGRSGSSLAKSVVVIAKVRAV
jgi:hypothetical protein